MRLSQYLAHCGIASRRKSEELINSGKVTVNGLVTANLTTNIEPTRDVVSYLGKKLEPQKNIYYAVNKPVGYTSSCFDPHAKKLITELFIGDSAYLRPVGRLDKNSCGLMIMTNDGRLINRVTHPRYQIDKEYLVTLDKPLSVSVLEQLAQSQMADGEIYRLDFIEKYRNNIYRVIISHGKKREIRISMKLVGRKIVNLERTRIGEVRLDGLISGKSRPLTDKEVASFFK